MDTPTVPVMKSQAQLARAFMALQSIINSAPPNCRINQAATSTLVTLAWALNLFPPHIEEVTTARIMGDPYKNMVQHVDMDGLMRVLLTAKAT